jgi:glycosyltransferase involved in cell wall biosynthesis
VRDGVDVVLIDAALSDPAAWITASSQFACKRVAIVRQQPVGLSGVDVAAFVDPRRLAVDGPLWQSRGVPTVEIPQGIELDETKPMSRNDFGVSDDAVVLVTASNQLETTFTPTFIEAVIQMLVAHPRAVFLAVGDAGQSTARRQFDTAGVGTRVGFAGKRRDWQNIVRMADVYLADLVGGDRDATLCAMLCGKPVVAADAGSTQRSITSRQLRLASSVDDYVAQAMRLLSNSELRKTVGEQLRTEANQRYSLSTTASRLVELIQSLHRPAVAAAA